MCGCSKNILKLLKISIPRLPLTSTLPIWIKQVKIFLNNSRKFSWKSLPPYKIWSSDERVCSHAKFDHLSVCFLFIEKFDSIWFWIHVMSKVDSIQHINIFMNHLYQYQPYFHWMFFSNFCTRTPTSVSPTFKQVYCILSQPLIILFQSLELLVNRP